MEPNNKCDLCALKVIFNQGELSKALHIEKYFETLRDLQGKKIIDKGYNRRIFVSSIASDGKDDKSEMCAVNSNFFLPENKDKKCPEFILNMDLAVTDALSLNLSNKTVNLTSDINRLTIFILIYTIILTVLAYVTVYR